MNYNDYIKESFVSSLGAAANSAAKAAAGKMISSLSALDPDYYKYEKSPIKGNIGEIQQFLIDMGTNVIDGKGGWTLLKKDWDFGKRTASAVWVYLYGGSSMIKSSSKYPQQKTVKELQTKLGVKSDGGAGKETLDEIARLFNAIVKRKISEEKAKSSVGTWNKDGVSKRYGTTIKNIMNGNTAPYQATFQSRQTFYREIHELLYASPNAEAKAAIKSFGLKPIHSNWFQAASAVNAANALGAADNINLWIMSDATEEMLRHCGVELLKGNIVTAKQMLLGTLNKTFVNTKGKNVKLEKSAQGQTLDNRLVEYEQTELNKIMSTYKGKVSKNTWKSMTDGINASFGLPAAPAVIAGVIKTYFGVKASASLGILDTILGTTSAAYRAVSDVVSGVSNYFNHTFNIDNYDNRATLGKGCVSAVYHGEGNYKGINLI